MKKITITAAALFICIFKINAQQVLASDQAVRLPATQTGDTKQNKSPDNKKNINNTGAVLLLSESPVAMPKDSLQNKIATGKKNMVSEGNSTPKIILPSEMPVTNNTATKKD